MTLNTDNDNSAYDDDDDDDNDDGGGSSNITVATTRSKLNKKAMLTLSSDCFFHLYTYCNLKHFKATHQNAEHKAIHQTYQAD